MVVVKTTMAAIKITTEIWDCTCERCGWVWLSRRSALPKVCMRCKSTGWHIVQNAYPQKPYVRRRWKYPQDLVLNLKPRSDFNKDPN